MIFFSADPRDAYRDSTACNSCCCAQATARPGETNKWAIDYRSWVVPMGGRGLTDRTEFSIERKSQSPDPNAPINTAKQFPVDFNTAFDGNVSTGASDPGGDPLTFRMSTLNAPKFGTAEVNQDGTFTYTPTLGFHGYDRFFIVTDNGVKSITTEVIMKVNSPNPTTPLADTTLTPDLAVVRKNMRVEGDAITFALAASPAVAVGDVYRMTVKQPAMDCDCNEFFHISCYDIAIVIC